MSWWIGASGHIDHVPGCWHGGCGYFDQQCWVGPWVASAIEPLAIGLDGRYLDPQNGHTDQKMFRKNAKIWRCNFSGYINGAIEKWTEPYAWDETSF